MRILFLSLTLALLAGCSNWGFPGVYRINVEQGNIVTQEMVEQLKPGMSRRQVRFILGTPLLEDPFNQARWDYPYVKRNGNEVLDEARLMVYFDGDKLVSFEGDVDQDYGSIEKVREDSADDEAFEDEAESES